MRTPPVIASLALLFGSPAHATLLSNADFETPQAAGSQLISTSGDWVQSGGVGQLAIHQASWAQDTGESGTQGVWLKAFNTDLDHHFYQDVVATPGMKYTLDAAFRFDTNFESNGSQVEMALIWLDVGSSEISRATHDVDDVLSTPGWNHTSVGATAPPGTTTVRSWFRFTTDSVIENSSQASVLIDTVSLTVIPEPLSGSLIGLGILVVGLLRRMTQ